MCVFFSDKIYYLSLLWKEGGGDKHMLKEYLQKHTPWVVGRHIPFPIPKALIFSVI